MRKILFNAFSRSQSRLSEFGRKKPNTGLIRHSALLCDALYVQRKRNQEECDQKGNKRIWHYHRQDVNKDGFNPIFIIFTWYLTIQRSPDICKAGYKCWFMYQSLHVYIDWSKQGDIQIIYIYIHIYTVSFITPADTH